MGRIVAGRTSWLSAHLNLSISKCQLVNTIGSKAAQGITISYNFTVQVLFWKNSVQFYVVSNKATFPTCHMI